MTNRILVALAVIATVGVATAATAEILIKDKPAAEVQAQAQGDTPESDRLVIVNGKTGKVIYDDGKDDLYCVTRKKIVGYDEDGDPIYRRVMRCR